MLLSLPSRPHTARPHPCPLPPRPAPCGRPRPPPLAPPPACAAEGSGLFPWGEGCKALRVGAAHGMRGAPPGTAAPSPAPCHLLRTHTLCARLVPTHGLHAGAAAAAGGGGGTLTPLTLGARAARSATRPRVPRRRSLRAAAALAPIALYRGPINCTPTWLRPSHLGPNQQPSHLLGCRLPPSYAARAPATTHAPTPDTSHQPL